MVDTFLDFMLGNLRGISQFYFEYQVIFNSIIVGIAAYNIMFAKKRHSKKETTN